MSLNTQGVYLWFVCVDLWVSLSRFVSLSASVDTSARTWQCIVHDLCICECCVWACSRAITVCMYVCELAQESSVCGACESSCQPTVQITRPPPTPCKSVLVKDGLDNQQSSYCLKWPISWIPERNSPVMCDWYAKNCRLEGFVWPWPGLLPVIWTTSSWNRIMQYCYPACYCWPSELHIMAAHTHYLHAILHVVSSVMDMAAPAVQNCCGLCTLSCVPLLENILQMWCFMYIQFLPEFPVMVFLPCNCMKGVMKLRLSIDQVMTNYWPCNGKLLTNQSDSKETRAAEMAVYSWGRYASRCLNWLFILLGHNGKSIEFCLWWGLEWRLYSLPFSSPFKPIWTVL